MDQRIASIYVLVLFVQGSILIHLRMRYILPYVLSNKIMAQLQSCFKQPAIGPYSCKAEVLFVPADGCVCVCV